MKSLLCFALLALAYAAPAISAADRPNILWLVTEDNVATTVGAYGDSLEIGRASCRERVCQYV